MKPEIIIIPVICAAICIAIGIWRGVAGDVPFLLVWLVAAALSFIPMIKALIARNKEKKNKKPKEDKK